MKIVIGKYYDRLAYANMELDTLRKEECMCLSCEHMQKCDIAKKFFEICIEHNMAVAITRCGVTDFNNKLLFKRKYLEEDEEE